MQDSIINGVAKKELMLFFASPLAYLFLLVFLAVTLFTFFWGEAFFARNVADVRPMFEWMPVLLAFLCAALTMRMWSEERRTGTLEFVATVPVSSWDFVVGKFLACWLLLAVALALTLPLPVSVAFVAELDWGPVFAGYLAALLLGGTYLSIGLFVSARTDSQIVSLIVASFVCGIFYLLGSPVLTDLVASSWASLLRSLGSGSRFESITRGVLDFRDLYFYASLLVAFLALNVHALEVQRWARDGNARRHRRWRVGTALLVGNLLLANVWLAGLTNLRVDVTEGRIYSISDATRGYLRQLKEPLLIRGYFSAKTHPLLAPLVPRMKDLLNEFEVEGQGQVRVELVDPAADPAVEDEANTKYGIRPVPFQTADRYQSSLVNSYFDVLLSYGDEYEVLDFRDLIEVKVVGEAELDVQLRNPEYDLTRSIKKILFGFQGGSSIFANIAEPVRFVGYISSDQVLPPALVEYRQVLAQALDQLSEESGGQFSAQIVDPQAGDGGVAVQIAEDYGFQPMATSLFDTNAFYFYLTLADSETMVQVPLPEALSAESTKRAVEAGLKRFASGLLKTVALVAPQVPPPYMGRGQPPQGNQFSQLRDALEQDFSVETATLEDGKVPEMADLLMVVDPEMLSEVQLFAMDQFLMKGGTVVVSASPFNATITQQSLMAVPRNTGLQDWLLHHGVEMGAEFVMDPQNAAFPAPVTREVGGFSFQELVMLDYPYFVDVRGVGLDHDSPITSGLPQITVSWASPIDVDEQSFADRRLTTLLASSDASWVSDATDVMPKFTEQGLSAFLPSGEIGARSLGILLEGRFDSYFAGKPSPLLALEQEEGDTDSAEPADADELDGASIISSLGVVDSVIARSTDAARLFVFSSNGFLADQTLRMVGSADGMVYGNSSQMMVNVVDWSLEDQGLLTIRSRGNFNRTLPPLASEEQVTMEAINYGLALLGVGLVALIYRRRMGRQRATHSNWIAGGTP